MRARHGVLTGLVLLAACGTSMGMSHGRTGRSCGASSGQTLAHSSRARVYSLNGGVFGCAYGSRHTYRLGSAARSVKEGRVGPARVAALDAAYGYTTSGVDTGSATVIVRRLTDGRQLRSIPSISGPVGPESFQTVDVVVLKPTGSVAWIAQSESVISGRTKVIEVQKSDAGGTKLLDKGSGIAKGSLKLKGSRLTWTDNGRPRSSTLN